MKKIFLILASIILNFVANGQSIDKIINVETVTTIEKTLAADDMQGRRTFTAGIEKASAFIEAEFGAIGLLPFNHAKNFRQDFAIYDAKRLSSKVSIDNKLIDENKIAYFSFQTEVNLTEKENVKVVHIKSGDDFGKKFYEYYQSNDNLLVLVDVSFDKYVGYIKDMEQLAFEKKNNAVVFVFGVTSAASYTIELKNQVSKKALNNVVGVLPGKSKPNEFVVFSGHYDHLGVSSPNEGAAHSATDSIYNGANDDAAGTTAVIMLAKYFKAINNNERTLLFVAFTAEEIGGYGSQYFSKQLEPEQVMAMFNLEMIGTDSKWGKNSAYITGYEKSSLGEILQKNLKGTSFQFYPDPYPEQQLFYRSDNATLAKLGVPAHTISTSKMDVEPNYHKASDQIETLDMINMTEIIKAIAISSTSIISGKDTPTRVDTKLLD